MNVVEASRDVTGSPAASATTTRLEEAICRVSGVRAARLVLGPGGRVAEVHVLATKERGPKQVVRDIQSVLLTGFGVELDYRTVSVVQLEEPATAAEEVRSALRPAITRLSQESEGHATRVTVDLSLDGVARTGSARGPATGGMKLVALAVVDAVGDLIADSAVDVESADLVRAGKHDVALTVLRLVTGRGDHVVSGSAIVRKDANDAMARAALAALNRLFQVR